MDVVVVESPAKARTIGTWLGKGYRVMATRGHVRDLPSKAGSVKPDEDFAMVYETGKRAARTLGAVAKALEKAEALILATDPDREGEAIAWQVLSWLEERDAIGGRPVRRVAFHEVTPAAVRAALAQPRGIDMDLVRAWQARRALDYLVGYGLSPVLWRKLPRCRSAGRVQSVALRLVCEREAGIEAFVAREYWTVEAEASAGDARFEVALARLDGAAVGDAGLATAGTAEDAARRIRDAAFTVASVERDTRARPPPPPFTTAALQQEGSRRLGFSIGETMETAQRLYEGVDLGGETAGLITYPRTDGTAMAKTAVAAARAVVRARFGDDYLPAKPRTYRPRARRADTPRHATEAHEAIRPTGFTRAPEDVEGRLDRASARLYGLVWRRALASQMAPARVDLVRIGLAPAAGADAGGIELAAQGSATAFDGLDRVAGGALAWRGMLAGFWDGFHAALEDAGGLERATVLAAVEARLDGFLFGAAPVSPDPVSPDRRRCPVCGSGELELRLGRYGPFVGCGAYPACGYRRRLAAVTEEEDGYTGPRGPSGRIPAPASRSPEGP